MVLIHDFFPIRLLTGLFRFSSCVRQINSAAMPEISQSLHQLPIISALMEATEISLAGPPVNMSLIIPGNNSSLHRLPTKVIQQIAVMSFFMILALAGNASLLIYLCKVKKHRNRISIFIKSLAISDLLIAIFSTSTELLWEAFGEWVFGSFLCKLATYVQCLLFASTAFILMSISYDRYQAICRPMKFKSRTMSRSRKMIVFSWCLAIVVAIPQFFIFLQEETGEYHDDGTPKYACKSKGYTAEWQRKVYVTWVATCVFLTPLFFVAFCYIQIAKVVWRIDKFPKNQGENGEHITLRRHLSKNFGSAERAKVRTIKLTICMLSCYILCWAPYFTLNLLNVWTGYKYKNQIPMAMQTVSKCLAWFSSCVNPIIYASFNIPHKSLRTLFCQKKQTVKTAAHVPVEKHFSAAAGDRNLMAVFENGNYRYKSSFELARRTVFEPML